MLNKPKSSHTGITKKPFYHTLVYPQPNLPHRLKKCLKTYINYADQWFNILYFDKPAGQETLKYTIEILTFFILETTMSLMAWDLDTKLTIKRPCSERAFFAVRRKDSSTKSAAGQVIPELCKQQNK